MNGNNLIKDYISGGKEIVIFCGAGLSIDLGLPSWKELTIEIINKVANDFEYEDLKTIIPSLDRNVIQIIDVLETVADRTYYKTVLDLITNKLKIHQDSLPLHEALLKLSSKIITTNYDTAFEIASKNSIDTFTYGNNFNISNISKSDSYIFKVHGDIKHPEGCLIFKKDYDNLYGSLNNYFFEMAKAFTDKVILFVGFSLADPYVVKLFDTINEAYQGITDKHFILTTDETKYEKYKDYLLPIKIDHFSDLKSKIVEFIDCKPNILNNKPVTLKQTVGVEQLTLQVLIPKPIDKENEYNAEVIANIYSSYDVKLIDNYFNVDKLTSLEEVDYIFIFTQFIKEQLLIEDEGLKFKLIKISELNSLESANLKGIFLFVDASDEEIQNIKEKEKINVPLVIIPTSKKLKESITTLIYKAFVKADVNLLGNTGLLLNADKFHLKILKRGAFQRQRVNTFISRFIDKKNLSKFVGRKSDQENIIRKILSMRYENKLLCIKGSGGIGKTSIISKIGIELAERGYFEKGVHFVACNPIQSFENFEFDISQCFNLTSSKFLKEQISETVFVKDRIIILDNFETLLYVEDKKKIIEMVSFLCDHSVVLVTSRQILDLDFEDIYELRNLTTDEGIELFKTIFTSTIPESQERVLRQDIIEKLLNNNPLAIKLIAKGLPASKNLITLKDELEENIFSKEEIEGIFEKLEDINIEKSTSLYHSINYSYINLSEKEKLAFELLSLFPDGMHMENFKTFFKSSKSNERIIGDKEIKLLDDKSLLENVNGFLKLQSIISRFSDYKFKTRSPEIRLEYHQLAYAFNKFFVGLMFSKKIGNSLGLKILDFNTNNYLKCLEYMSLLELPGDERLKFIAKVSMIFRDTNQPSDFINFIKNSNFNLDSKLNEILEIIIQNLIYWTKDFDKPLKYIKDNFPFNSLESLNEADSLDAIKIARIFPVYKAEGYDFEVLKLYIKIPLLEYNMADLYFKLGYLQEAYLLVPQKQSDKDYFDYEIELSNGLLELNEVNKYLQSLYKKESLEMTQVTYLKSKITTVTNDEIKKLVISNPYTKGLIYLMQAKNETDYLNKIDLFEKAKVNLKHVKYHYVECLIEYISTLKEEGDDELYLNNWSEAVSICKEFFFRHLLYRLELFENSSLLAYNENYFKLPVDYQILKEFIIEKIKKNREYYNNTKTGIIQKNITSISADFSTNLN
jgi:hypothetical protein